jgi:hypothetical protein
MRTIPWFHYLWKVPLCGILFFIGFIPGGQLATMMGLPAPEMPMGADPAIVGQYTILTSLILALGLALLARGLSGNFLSRWLILFSFTWIAYGVNTYFEALIFSTLSAASLYAIVLYLPASLLCAAAVAWLFPPAIKAEGFLARARTFFASYSAGSWIWRLVAAFLAFPVAYYIFGRLISPIVLPYYLQGSNELALPGWNQILPVLAIRSAFFLLACLPILIAWNFSNRRLFLTLGLALFILVGGIAMIQAYWLPMVLRVTHGLEIFADEVVYTAALVLLLRPHVAPNKAQQQIPLPARP